jgi:hypothetical protein
MTNERLLSRKLSTAGRSAVMSPFTAGAAAAQHSIIPLAAD